MAGVFSPSLLLCSGRPGTAGKLPTISILYNNPVFLLYLLSAMFPLGAGREEPRRSLQCYIVYYSERWVGALYRATYAWRDAQCPARATGLHRDTLLTHSRTRSYAHTLTHTQSRAHIDNVIARPSRTGHDSEYIEQIFITVYVSCSLFVSVAVPLEINPVASTTSSSA